MVIMDKIPEELQSENLISDVSIALSADMFRQSKIIIANNGKATVLNNNNEPVCFLRFYPTTYSHAYTYSGELDLSFLNQYDCLILNDCNEYSVELCRTALTKWTGHRLILVGDLWSLLIPYLPDLPEIKCFQENSLTSENMANLITGTNFLCIVTGMPHAEDMSRFENHVMYYDEVMSFTYLFSDCRNLGNDNPDKKFYVVDGLYGNLGLFALASKAMSLAKYVKTKGFIPIMHTLCNGNSFYQDNKTEDVWSKFFCQPEGYDYNDIQTSKYVYFAPTLYNGTIMERLMDKTSANTTLTWPSGFYNTRITNYIFEREKIFLPYPNKTLGLLARGTDYKTTHLANHAIHASKEELLSCTAKAMNKWGYEYVYIATEDSEYINFFSSNLGDKLFFTDQERFSTKDGERLSDMHRENNSKREGFLLGAEYILSVYLLSKCDSLIASGDCGALGQALALNEGKYKNIAKYNGHIWDIDNNIN